jgi:hypothetical protein
MQTDVILKYLGHQAIDATAYICQQHQNISAVVPVDRERSIAVQAFPNQDKLYLMLSPAVENEWPAYGHPLSGSTLIQAPACRGCLSTGERTAGPSTALPGFPVESRGFDDLHAALFKESRTRGRC